uniref:hypothetical protein n=1 Tax=uncultured Sphingomonas sp. TaxID=158754 RepID=UPI0035CC36EA
MTILTSTTETIPYKAPWREDDPAAPVFHLRQGTVIERGQMEAELAGQHRAGKVYGFALRAAERSGVLSLLSGDPGHGEILSLLDAEQEGDAEGFTETQKRLLTETRAILAEHWPEYRDLIMQRERRRVIAPIVALRRFCTNIVGENVAFSKTIDNMVSDATLSALDELEIAMAGNRAFSLQFPSEDALGNSPPASSPADARATSPSGSASKAVGRSKARSGPRTRS